MKRKDMSEHGKLTHDLITDQLQQFTNGEQQEALQNNHQPLLEAISQTYTQYQQEVERLQLANEQCALEMEKLYELIGSEADNLKSLHLELERLLNAVGFGFYSVDLRTGQYLYLSKGMQTIYGYSKAEFLADNMLWFDIVNANDKAKVTDNHTRLKSGEKLIHQYRITKKNGMEAWLESHVLPGFNRAGAVTRVDGLIKDITQRKENELQIEEQKNYLDTILAASLDAVVIIDTDSNILHWDSKAEKLFGWTEAEVKGKPMSSFIIPPAMRKQHRMGMQRYFQSGEHAILNKTVDMQAINKAGEEMHVSLSVAPTKLNNQVVFIGFMLDISARKRMELQLKASYSEMNRTLDSIQEIVFSIEMPGVRITRVSAAIETISGYAAEAFYKDPELWFRLVHPEDREAVMSSVQQCFVEKAVQERFRVINRWGEEKWLETRTATTQDENGQLIRLDGVCIDITEKHLAEKNLQRREEEFREFFNSASEMLLTLSADDFTVLDANKKATELLMLPKEALIDQRIDTAAFSGSAHNNCLTAYLQQLTTGVEATLSYAFKNADGTPVPCQVKLKKVDLEGRSVVRLQAIDRTAENEARMQALASEERYRMVTESPSIGVVWGNPDGTVLQANQALADMLGYPQQELVGMHFSAYTHPDDHNTGITAIAKLANGHSDNYTCEKRYITKSGKIMWGQISISRMHEPHSGKQYNIGVVQDITARKNAEMELQKLNMVLEKKVKERTARLEEANKDLEVMNLAMSHDLRTPLRGIGIFSSLLRKKLGTADMETLQGYLHYIETGVQEMDALIGHLLAFAKANKTVENSELQKEKVDMKKLVEEVAEKVKALETGRSIQIDVAPLPTATADPKLMTQVWTNLISNAVKYTQPGKPVHINISGKRTKGKVIYRIADNGIGFTEQDGAKLFQPFSRLHTDACYQGNGLGLYIVHKIAKYHGGNITAKAKLGEGATFTFEIPVTGC